MRIVLPAFSFLLLVACGGDEGAGFTASITSPVSGTSVVENQVVLLEGQVSEGIHLLEALEASWWSGERLLCKYKKLDELGGSSCEAPLRAGESTVTFVARKPGLAGLPDEAVQDEISFAVVSEKDAPRCTIVDPASDWGMVSGSSLEITGLLQLPQGEASGEEITWWSDQAGQLGSSSTDGDGRTAFVLQGLEDGAHQVDMRFEGSDFGSCTASVRIGVGPVPGVAIVSPSGEASITEGEKLTAVAEVTHTESVSLSWISDIDGVLKTRTIRAGGESTLQTSELSAGVHELSAVAQDALGVPGIDTVQITVKGIPTAPKVRVLPEQPLEEDTLTVEFDRESTDPEGQALVYRYQWLRDGVLQATDVTSIDASLTRVGESWEVQVWAESSTRVGHVGTASVRIDGFVGWGGQPFSLSASDATVRGTQEDDLAGTAVAGHCDLDGDGLDDLLVGAPDQDEGGSNSGRSYVVRGSELASGGTLDLYYSKESLIGQAPGDYSGSSLACNGDVNGDGEADILVGSPGHGSSQGAVHLVLGSEFSGDMDLFDASFWMEGENPGDLLGTEVTFAGDVDGDGLSEVLLGSWANDDQGTFSGKAYLIAGEDLSGGARLALGSDAVSWQGEAGGDRLGHSVAGIGDVDGDGLDDVAMGAYGYDSGGTLSYQGAVYVHLSSDGISGQGNSAGAASQVLVGDDAKHYAGYSLSPLGDLDEDGAADFLVGASGYSSSSGGGGAAYVVWGSELSGGVASLADVSLVLEGEMVGDSVASSLSAVGDVDRDGLPDFLVGASSVDANHPDGGQAYLMLGSDVSPSSSAMSLGQASFVFSSSASRELAGAAVSGGDFDGDGFSDIVVGAPSAGTNKPYRGHSYVLFAQ